RDEAPFLADREGEDVVADDVVAAAGLGHGDVIDAGREEIRRDAAAEAVLPKRPLVGTRGQTVGARRGEKDLARLRGHADVDAPRRERLVDGELEDDVDRHVGRSRIDRFARVAAGDEDGVVIKRKRLTYARAPRNL